MSIFFLILIKNFHLAEVEKKGKKLLVNPLDEMLASPVQDYSQNFGSLSSVIVRVSVVLKRTVGDSD